MNFKKIERKKRKIRMLVTANGTQSASAQSITYTLKDKFNWFVLQLNISINMDSKTPAFHKPKFVIEMQSI